MSLSLQVSPIPSLLVLQLPTRLTFTPSTPVDEGSSVSVMEDDGSSGLFGILRERLNEAATQPPLTVQFPAGLSSDKASLNKVTSGTTPKARALRLNGKGPKARAGARRATKARPRLLILAVATV